ncbi:hypothetical protein J2S40_002241 [Nocardioides luteus]|uniref:Uncharacterized protein n=1 Tax=Nocardioides luteus TaxID=1844 RepID=A0ABQ5SS30_9ACTN|nr:hypothetical protein [Nocardioides luteus]MDR7311183.1 hypothetical protein [Nocardioides luteus]GGR62867.1 hypothetical protein GCM10010197_32710 [Nocardioides luteus]GLJ66729.1 hypothetical protein GCM10017579_07650 [Nocardioides luteus]
MRRILGGVATTVALLLASFTIPGLVPAASAASVGTVSVSAPSFKFPSYGTGCYYGKDYKVTVPVSGVGYDGADIDVELRITAPDRSYFDSAFGYKSVSKNGTYTFTLDGSFYCHYLDRRGTYTAKAIVSVLDWSTYAETKRTATKTFSVSNTRKASNIAYTAKKKSGAHSWKVSGTLTRNGARQVGKTVKLQVKKGGAWRTVKSAKTSGKAGKRGTVAIVWNPPSTRSYRLYYAGDAYTLADGSKAFKLRNR